MVQQVSLLLHRHWKVDSYSTCVRSATTSSGPKRSGGASNGSAQETTFRSPSDLPAQVLPGNLMSPLKNRVVSSPVAWQLYTHPHPSGHSCSLGSFISYATTFLSSHHELTLASDLNFSPLSPIPISPETIADRSRRML
jgi:hypothetical protein